MFSALILALSAFTSALSRNQIVAAIFAFALLVVLFSVGLLEQLASAPALKSALGYMNLWDHMDDFAKGLVDTRHVVYNLSLAGLFLFLATKALEAKKGR